MRRNSHLTVIAGFVLSAILLAAGGLLLWGSTYTHNMVHNQLAAQQIYFPPKAAFAHAKAGTEITPSMIPSVSQYAGQQLVTGQQAQSYADNFIAVHITNMTGGKTYAQLSAASLAQPNNTKLAGEVGCRPVAAQNRCRPRQRGRDLVQAGPLRLPVPHGRSVSPAPGDVRGDRGGGEKHGEQRAEHDGLGAVGPAPQRVPVQPQSAQQPGQPACPELHRTHPLRRPCLRPRGLCRPPCAAAVRAARGHWSRR